MELKKLLEDIHYVQKLRRQIEWDRLKDNDTSIHERMLKETEEKIKSAKTEIESKLDDYAKITKYPSSTELYHNMEKLEEQVKELQQENRQLKFRLADEQDCNQHGECHQIIQNLKQKLEKIRELGRKIEYGNPEDNEFINVPDEIKSILESKE